MNQRSHPEVKVTVGRATLLEAAVTAGYLLPLGVLLAAFAAGIAIPFWLYMAVVLVSVALPFALGRWRSAPDEPQEPRLGTPTDTVSSGAMQPDENAPRHRPLLSLALALATLVTTTYVGAAHRGVNLIRDPGAWKIGLPYALGVMLILGVHEMGHYLTARRHGLRVSLPYFIPLYGVPLAEVDSPRVDKRGADRVEGCS